MTDVSHIKPSRHKTLNQCWFSLVHRLRRWINAKPTLTQRLVSSGFLCKSSRDYLPDWQQTRGAHHVGRCPHIKTTLGQRLVLCGLADTGQIMSDTGNKTKNIH